ncbi:hypothetical protein DFO66_11477 [Brevibacterium sanguinis]|uniref:Adhesin n=2 Tax=Brevibacterium TaxID=1696 RepID=A0A366IDV4_9MICO|nr:MULTISPECIES: hypothetical protein [Brevibacterium]RBP62569.1 hypothetical protein DFO66_11477 [Brevibacterium sanguinis]RBP69233.1 hypothetical protein DFO65_11477 [Brevibacterium celere]
MPSTVQLNPSTRSTLRALIVIAAIIVILIPVGITVAHGVSRLGYGKVEVTEPLSASMTDLQFALDTGAEVVVRTTQTDAPSVTLTGTGPRGEAPDLEVRETGTTTIVAVTGRDFENARIEAFVPAQTSDDVALDLSGGYGTIDVAGDFREVLAQSDGGEIDIHGSADRVRTTTDWGMTTLSGTFGSIESKTDVGAFDGIDLAVRDRVDVTSTTGAISLDFSNQMVPLSGIVAKADEGVIEVRLPRLDVARSTMAAAAGTGEGTEGTDDGAGAAGAEEAENPDGADPAAAAALARELFYQINASSTSGTVDLAKELEKYDASRDTKDAEGKTVIPVSLSTDTGTIEIDEN